MITSHGDIALPLAGGFSIRTSAATTNKGQISKVEDEVASAVNSLELESRCSIFDLDTYVIPVSYCDSLFHQMASGVCDYVTIARRKTSCTTNELKPSDLF